MPLGTEVGLDRDDTVRWGPAPPYTKGALHPNFQPMSIVAKRLPILTTAELLFKLSACGQQGHKHFAGRPCPLCPRMATALDSGRSLNCLCQDQEVLEVDCCNRMSQLKQLACMSTN